MKRNLQIILTATTASFLTFAVMAQEAATPKSDRPVSARDRANLFPADRLQGAVKASDIIGMTVENRQGETLGSVDDLAVDVESGRIVQVILATGGFVGMGERLSAVPPGALRHDVAGKVLHLDASKEKIKDAPAFTTAKWAEHSGSSQLSAVYAYYGQESAFTFVRKGDLADGAARRRADETGERERLTSEGQWLIPASRLGQIQQASKLMGLAVKNHQGQNLGSVDELLLDVQSGRILLVVVSSGGFLGIGDELSAVPPTSLSFNADRDALLLDATKDTLSAAPRFKADQWPDFSQPMHSDRVYRAYKQEPYFTTGTARDADNAARNARDRDGRTLTPMDQGNSKADTDTTAQIRRGILAGDNMSVNARNVKIITNNGRVTLRGPVRTEEEKRTIGEIANRIARPENVDNQLEVTLILIGN